MSSKSDDSGCASCVFLILVIAVVAMFFYDYERLKNDVKELKKQVEAMNAQ
jgi:hypothetical protein